MDERASETNDGILESAQRIIGILDQEAALGLPYSRMALAGFSQGGAMTLFTGLQLPVEKKLAGLVVLSGYLAGSLALLFIIIESSAIVQERHCSSLRPVWRRCQSYTATDPQTQ